MHLTENDILLYIEKKTDDREKAEVEIHLAECNECISRLAMIYKLPKEIQNIKTPELKKEYFERAKNLVRNIEYNTSLRKAKPKLAYILAGALIIIVTISIILSKIYIWESSYESTYRMNDLNSNQLSLFPPDNSEITSDSFTLSWIKITNAIEYKVSIFDENGKLLIDESLTDTILSVNQIKNLKSGYNYLWKVEVLLPDGRTIKSPLYSFQYSPEE